MKINIKTGMAWGIGELLKPMILLRYRGGQRARRMPASITIPKTSRRLEIARIFTELAQEANELSLQERHNWANCFYQGASIREKKQTVRYPWFMKRHDIRPGDWRSAFLYCNLLAAFSMMKWPRKKAPIIARHFPPSPGIEAKFNEEKFIIEGKIKVFYLSQYNKEAVVRLWVAFQYMQSVKGYLHGLFDVGGGPLTNLEIPFTIDMIRCAGTVFGVESVSLKDMLWGEIFVYADVISAYGPDWGAIPSDYSNVEEIVMPKRARYIHTKNRKCLFTIKPGVKVSKFALDLAKRLRKYKKTHRGYRGLNKLIFVNLPKQNKMPKVLQYVGKSKP